MNARRPLASVATFGILAAGGLMAATAPAHAAADSPKCKHPCSSKPGKGWHYLDYYFWKDDCAADGAKGVRHDIWKKYKCKGSLWTDYDLWVKY
ncbi:hypothetical protein J4573_39695 [Actinomadura barringtoniae]|uniref:Uncharacterized protein n=1 Tax=Actinomadura barringtoniae TaxID=1427535 RepID=A0A939PQE5_9ACTN|nr:hypothetical protein [Actinomadura barringtoniae]MBO2453274.1 hypothetical protein [Actinomadura barringtoniae]